MVLPLPTRLPIHNGSLTTRLPTHHGPSPPYLPFDTTPSPPRFLLTTAPYPPGFLPTPAPYPPRLPTYPGSLFTPTPFPPGHPGDNERRRTGRHRRMVQRGWKTNPHINSDSAQATYTERNKLVTSEQQLNHA